MDLTTYAQAERSARRALRGHWFVLVLLLCVVTAALALNTFATGTGTGTSDRESSHADVPAVIRDGGPVIDATGAQPQSFTPADRRIALTFDDGPDPTWTPLILKVLADHQVHATFFVIGAHVAQHPGLLEAIRQAGHEIGVHTFTHVNLSDVGRQRLSLELATTQLAIAGATGITTKLFRPPYGSGTDSIDDAQWRVVRDARSDGFLTVLSSQNSSDWQRPGVDPIIEYSWPEGNAGKILLMHDGGGDRSQTVEALDILITELKTDGFAFTTVTGAIGQSSAHSPAARHVRLRGMALIWATQAAAPTRHLLSVLVTILAVLATIRMLILAFAAFRHARRRQATLDITSDEPVSVVVPAYNEAVSIAATLTSLVASTHRRLEVVVVDDGSTDATAECVLGLDLPQVRLIRQGRLGKAAALNNGIAHTSLELLIFVDADTIFGPETIRHLLRPFSDPEVGAVSGNTKVANRRGLLGCWQHIEYVMGFNLDRRAFDLARCMPTIPGAVGAYRRCALSDVGRLSGATLAEDTDLTMALGRAGWRMVYAEHAHAWTEAPGTLTQLWRQRQRWCYGTVQAMWKHRRAIIARGAEGRWGRRALGYLTVFHVLLPLLAPLIDLYLVYGAIVSDSGRAAVVWVSCLLANLMLTGYAFRLDGEQLRPLWIFPLQQLFYRQLLCLVVAQSVFAALAGVPLRWHKLQRQGEIYVVPSIPGQPARTLGRPADDSGHAWDIVPSPGANIPN